MPIEDSQIDQINKMNASNMAKELAIDSYDERSWIGITGDIQTGKYNTVRDKGPSYTKCNIFLDDMLKKYYGIKLPRRGDFKDPFARERTSEGVFKGWEENPVTASILSQFFIYASNLEGTGINEVSPMEGSKLTAKGKPVVVLGGGHATLAAPHQRWPLVYRSDRSFRGEDRRIAVGLKKGAEPFFFVIGPEAYKKFMRVLSKFKADDVMNPYSESGKELRKQLKEIK